MRDVLVIYYFPHHSGLLEGQCSSLKEYGFNIDALLFNNIMIKYLSSNNGKAPFLYYICSFLYNKFHNMRGFNRLGLRNFLINKSFESLFKNYKIIEFAGVYNPKILDLARKAKEKGKKIISKPWDHYILDWHEDLYKLSDVINVGAMKNAYAVLFPQYVNKFESVSYGLSQLNLLNGMLDGKVQKDISFLSDEAKGRTIVTIGYSGRAWHQHFYVIDAIEQLPIEMKDKLFLLFPMTYANTDRFYNDYLLERVKQTGVPFQLLTKHLSLLENLSMRMISDIVIIWQLNDANSASVQEHLMAGSVLVAGDWLPYKRFREYGAYLHNSTKDNLIQTLYAVWNNIDLEKEKSKINRKVIYKLSSWDNKGKEFAHMYNRLYGIE